MKWNAVLVPIFLMLTLSGCGPVFGRHYSIVLLDKPGLEIIGTGEIKGDGIFPYKNIPTAYELRREKFTLRLEPMGIDPMLRISSNDKRLSVLANTASSSNNHLECHLTMKDDWSDSSEILFFWNQNKDCKNAEIEIQVIDSAGSVVGRENLPFKIVDDGYYFYIEGA